MQTKKIRDILPPRRAVRELPVEEEKQPVSPKKQRSAPRAGGIFAALIFRILLAGVASALALHFIFATATVSVWPNTREVSVAGRVLALSGEKTLDPAASMVSASTISEEKEITRLFAATGKATQEGKAQGIIRVFNGFSVFSQKLVANTRFLSEEGKLFRSQDAVIVPGGRQEGGKLVAGFLDIEVQAAEAGEAYNIGPSNFSLPGLFGNPAYTSIYGRSSETISGGNQEEGAVVTESDLTAARDALVQELRQNVRESLQARVPDDMVLLQEAVALEVKEASSPIKPGARLDNFNFSAKVQGFATLFLKADVENVAKARIRDLTKEGEKLNEETMQISYENIEMNTSSQSISFDAKVRALLYEDIDPVDLEAHLAGISREDAATLLSKNSALEKAEIILFPPWLGFFPKDSRNVHVKLVID